MRFKDRFIKFMYGRYGSDKFGLFLLYTALIIMIVNMFVNSVVLFIVELTIIGYSFFRIFSKNVQKRYRENLVFEKVWNRMMRFFRLRKKMWHDRKTHVFVKCPKCKSNLRLPKIKGEHTVRCVKCNNRFNFTCK